MLIFKKKMVLNAVAEVSTSCLNEGLLENYQVTGGPIRQCVYNIWYLLYREFS